MNRYWYTTCRLCGQGRLFIFKKQDTNELYLHCEECESGWCDPSRIGDMDSSFLTLDEGFKAEFAAWTDIENAHWQQFALNAG